MTMGAFHLSKEEAPLAFLCTFVLSETSQNLLSLERSGLLYVTPAVSCLAADPLSRIWLTLVGPGASFLGSSARP